MSSNALIKKALRCLIILGQADSEISKQEVDEATALLRVIDREDLTGSSTDDMLDEQRNRLGS
jgi:hypothetical protein